jgi:hypothetical protein
VCFLLLKKVSSKNSRLNRCFSVNKFVSQKSTIKISL